MKYITVVTHTSVLNDSRYVWVVCRSSWRWIARLEAWFWNNSGEDFVAFVEEL